MIVLEKTKWGYDPKFKFMTKEQRKEHLEMSIKRLREANQKAQTMFKRFPTLMELKLIEEEDKKLTESWYYDIDYNQDLYWLAF